MRHLTAGILLSLCLATLGLFTSAAADHATAGSPAAGTPHVAAGGGIPAVAWETGPNQLCPADSAVVADTYLFALGGYGSCDPTDIQRSQIRPDGRLDEWARDEARLPFNLRGFKTFSYNGFVYLYWGYDASSGNPVDSVEFARVSNDEWNGWWSFTPPPTFQLVATKGRFFSFQLITGSLGNDSLLAQGAAINPDGSPGAWTDLGDMGRHAPAAVASYGDWIYLISDVDNDNGKSVYRTAVGADGSLGPLEAMTPMSSRTLTATVLRDSIYVFDGLVVMRTGILPDGSLSAWETLPSPPGGRLSAGLVSGYGSLYAVVGPASGSQTPATLRLRLAPYSQYLPMVVNGTPPGGEDYGSSAYATVPFGSHSLAASITMTCTETCSEWTRRRGQ